MKDTKNDFIHLWLLAALVPILTIFFSFVYQPWSWGLMDDVSILSSGRNAVERIVSYFTATIKFGQFKPFFAIHSGIFYSLFEGNPKAFYFFKLFETVCVLCIWGWVAFRITKNRLALVLLPAVTLSFHYFYDTFFYLSTHEIIGLFFLGLALNSFLCNHGPNGEPLNHPMPWVLGAVFLFFSFCSKEPFVSCGIAAGCSYLFAAWLRRGEARGRIFLLIGILLMLITLAHAFVLVKFVRTSYTAQYDVNNTSKIFQNVFVWVKKDFLNHLPWILAAILILGIRRRDGRRYHETFSLNKKWGVALGGLLYAGYAVILLPWNTGCYYAAPLGVFFALVVTILLAEPLSRLNPRMHVFLAIFAIILNQLVCQYALNREAVYQYDTINMMRWLKTDPVFAAEIKDRQVCCNAWEASDAIPEIINRETKMNMPRFMYGVSPKAQPGRCDYFLYTRRFMGIDLDIFKDWDIVFLSRDWVLYKQPAAFNDRTPR